MLAPYFAALQLLPDHRFTLLIHGEESVIVIADWKAPCWMREPVYMDSIADTLYFTVPEDYYDETDEGRPGRPGDSLG